MSPVLAPKSIEHVTTDNDVAEGAARGLLGGALINMGVDEDEARAYDERFQSGEILVMVETDDDRYDDVRSTFDDD